MIDFIGVVGGCAESFFCRVSLSYCYGPSNRFRGVGPLYGLGHIKYSIKAADANPLKTSKLLNDRLISMKALLGRPNLGFPLKTSINADNLSMKEGGFKSRTHLFLWRVLPLVRTGKVKKIAQRK